MLRTENCRSKVMVDGAESAEYTVGHGLREGAVLSPVLYAVFIDDIARRLAASCSGVSVGTETINCLLYADDICITADSLCDVLMSDDLPHETENTMYRYLIAISRLRLGILTERGEGS